MKAAQRFAVGERSLGSVAQDADNALKILMKAAM